MEEGAERPLTRRTSAAPLRIPQPELGLNQGTRHIEALERSAEELSSGGSDIGERIRELSRQNSTASSRQGGFPRSRKRVNSGGRSRTSSYSIVDVNNSARWGGYSPGAFIASPTGSVRSGTGTSWTHASVKRAASETKSSRLGQMVEPLQEGQPLDSPLAPSSASMHSQEHAMSRQASSSSFSRRYDQIASQIEESLHAVPPTPPMEQQQQQSHHEEYHMQHHQQQHVEDPIDRPHSTDTFQEAQLAFKDFDGVHFDPDREEYVEVDDHGNEVRRISARTSSGSLLNAASLLRTPRARISYGVPPPNDGMVYYPAPVPRMLNLPKRLSQQPPSHIKAQRRSQMLSQLPPGARESAPWIPPVNFSDGTRSQRSGSGSTTQQDHPRGMLNQRMSVANAHNLPPQLRASMFFEHQSIPHDVEVKNESAVATLDAILASSATAPVTAFTDHPYAGDVRKTVYAPEKPAHKRRSTATTIGNGGLDSAEKKLKKRRSSSIGNFFRRNSTDLEGETKRPASRGSNLDFNEGGNKLRKRRSQMSLGGDFERVEQPVRTPADEIDDPMRRQSGLIGSVLNASPRQDLDHGDSRPMTAMSGGRPLDDADQIRQDFKDEDALEDLEETDAIYAQPTTLLAELQVRKAQLKSRNRTAATAFPNGMHSTLLQLDAVEQIEAKKRQKQKIALAWEDPNLRGVHDGVGADEDIPLGMLFPGKDGAAHRKMGDGRDWDRPLGLMERRELEDNEPLSSRRKRMNPNARPLMTKRGMSQVHLAGQPDMPTEDTDDEGETLGQRLRRLKTKDALDGAISDIAPKNGERPVSTFGQDLLDQFGGLEVKNPETADNQAAGGSEVEETLGQRRARLQREREASGEHSSPAERLPLRTTQSMANLLSANPIGSRLANRDQSAAQGTLLHASAQHQMKQKMDLAATNMRSSSYMLDKPLVDSRPQVTGNVPGGLLANTTSRPAKGAYVGGLYNPGQQDPMQRQVSLGGLVGQQQSRPTNGAFAGGFYNNTGGGVQIHPSAPQPMVNVGMGGGTGYASFASPTAGMAGGMNYGAYGGAGGMMPGYAMQQPQLQQQPSMMNNAAYYALHGGQQPGMMPAAYGNPMGAAGGYAGYATQTPQQMGYGAAPGTPMGMNMNMNMGGPVGIEGLPLNPNQRDAIDRWRAGVV